MRLVVIGGVAAGLSAAARARRLDRGLDILVLEKGEVISYSACGLPYFVQGRVRSLDRLSVYSPEYFARERKIAVRTGADVAAIEHGRRQAVLASGERIRYDRLVLATGAAPSHTLPGAFTLHTPQDARRLHAFLRAHKPKRAAVVGAGYIGLEAAEALRTHGLAVTLYDADADILGRSDAELTARIQKHLERFRVAVRLATPVRSSEELNADVVVLAAGLRPNVSLAAEAGVARGSTGALRVDESMATNLSGVWAAGDCAETTHLVTGRPVWIPLGTTANKMGRVAGANAAGGHERFPGIVGTSVVSVCGLGIGLTGLSETEARREGFHPVSARIDARDRPGYFHGRPTSVELVADRRTGRLLGGWVLGEQGVAGRINVIATALTAQLTVGEFQHLDLAYAPPFAPVWDPLLIAAQNLLKLCGGKL